MIMANIMKKNSVLFVLSFACIIHCFHVCAEDAKHIQVEAKGTLGGLAQINCTVLKTTGKVSWKFAGNPVNITGRYTETNLTKLNSTDKDGIKIELTTYVLTISNTTLNDVGNYTCVYELEERSATLDMKFPGKFLHANNETVYRNYLKEEDRNVTLYCVFEVYNLTRVRWLKEGETRPRQDGNATKINERQVNSTFNFRISNSDDDNGVYICKMDDPMLPINEPLVGKINLIVYDRPIINLKKLIPISDTELYLEWNVTTHNGDIQSYNLLYSNLEKKSEKLHYSKKPAVNVTNFIMENLEKSTNYSVYLKVTTQFDSSEASLTARTLDVKPDFVPVISIKGFSATSVTIGWESPDPNIINLIHYYELQARKKEKTSWMTAYHMRDERNLPYMFENLEPHNTYVFRVHACSEYTKVCGNWSEEMQAATMDGKPSAPRIVDISCDARQMKLRWKEPVVLNAEIKGYTMDLIGIAINFTDIFGKLRNETWGPLTKFMTNDSRNATFDLQPNTFYKVQLSALTRTRKRGESVETNCTSLSAPPDTPPRPAWRKIVENDKYMFQVFLPRISERNGPICCYRVYMVKLPVVWNWNRNPDEINVVTYEKAHETDSIGAYITDIFDNDHFPTETELIMGDGNIKYEREAIRKREECRRCLKKPDTKDVTTTRVPDTTARQPDDTTTEDDLPDTRRRRETIYNDEVVPTDGNLNNRYNYTLFVEVIPGEVDNARIYSEYLNVLRPAPSPAPARPINALEIALQATCAIAAAVLIGMIIFCVMHARRSKKDEMPTIRDTIIRLVRRRPLGGNVVPPDLPPIALEDLAAAYTERQLDSDYLFQKEFEMLPDCFGDRTTHASEARENQPKNRYPDIRAYDQTRVKLSQVDGITGSDYINANFVTGYQEHKKFICAQGPTDTTLSDFWRMMWEHGLELIVMLTNLEEYSKVKCSKYWPDEVKGSRVFGNIIVHHVSEKRYSDYIVRELKMTKQPTTADGQPIVENNGIAKRNGDVKDAEEGSAPTSPRELKETAEVRTVKQYHFLVWKDFVAPEHPHSILKFIKRINEAWLSVSGRPVVVHCSAGVGRTGTLVALDCLLDQLRAVGHATVFNTVADLRRQRNHLVQSLKQYVFVYRALVEYAHYGDTEIPASRLKTAIDRLRNTPEGGKCLLELEFEKMIHGPVLEPIKSCTAGSPEEVRARNRSGDCLPYDRNRVILAPQPGVAYSTYINASFIEAYDNSEGFIITQDPLPNTIMDFWRMTLEHNVNTIVMLSELGDGKCPRYWDDGTAQYEHISVQYEESESCPYYTRRQFRVTNTKNGEVRCVRQLQYHGWPTAPGHVPEVTRGLAELADAAQPYPPLNPPPTMLVHCQYGTERSSLFVALCVLIAQLRIERRVDVSAVARKVRSQRANTIDTFLQYEFLHRAILNYAELHNLLEDS